MARINLDMDVLRTLVSASELGALNRAAEQVGRSQSAVSQQIHKLEEQVGQPLFRKQGRGLVLTDAGDILLSYARRILELNDEAVSAVHGGSVEGAVRFGLPSDFAENWLPAVLGRFKRAHPAVRIEASVDRNVMLLDRLEKGQLDLALVLGQHARTDAEPIARLPMAWIGGSAFDWKNEEPVPLVLFEPPCAFRQAAVSALDAAGLPWRVTFTSPSLAGLWAAVDAGLGITLRTTASKPAHLKLLTAKSGLPRLPATDLSLHTAGRALSPAVKRLKDILCDTLPATLKSAAA
jgi:DNA-binding transcriptional LysR family regulator